MLSRLRTRIGTVLVLALGAVFMALPAFADDPDGVTVVNDAVSDGVGDATEIVTTNIPLILGVVLLFVVLRFGRKLLNMIR